MTVVPHEEIEKEKIRERLALAEEFRLNPDLKKTYLAALFSGVTQPPPPLTFEPDTEESMPALNLP